MTWGVVLHTYWSWIRHFQKQPCLITLPECNQTTHTTVWQLQECKISSRFPHLCNHFWQIWSYTACNVASNMQRRPSKHLSKVDLVTTMICTHVVLFTYPILPLRPRVSDCAWSPLYPTIPPPPPYPLLLLPLPFVVGAAPVDNLKIWTVSVTLETHKSVLERLKVIE